MTETVERMLPLYEGKMINLHDHRWATHEPDGTIRDVTLAEKQDPANAIRQLQQDFAATEQAAAKLQKGLPAKQQKEAASQLELLDQLAAGGQTALLMIQAQQAGRPVTAEAFYQKLCSLQAALPSPEQTAISDETAAAFLQEAIRWQDDQRGQAAAVPNS